MTKEEQERLIRELSEREKSKKELEEMIQRRIEEEKRKTEQNKK